MEYPSVKDYLSLNWSLIPVNKDKSPAVAWEKYQNSRADTSQVNDWLKQGYGLGLVCGEISGVVVVDDDRLKHDLPEYGLSSSIVCKTKNGARHFYYKYTIPVKNKVNRKLYVDIRANGGQVCIPPTEGYEWISPPTAENIAKLTPLPQKVMDIFFKSKTNKVSPSEILGTEEGGRNDGLLRYALSVLNKYPESEWETLVKRLVMGMNYTFNPPLDESEAELVFEQACQYIHDNPKTNKPGYQKENIPAPEDKPVVYADMSDAEIDALERRERLPVGIPKLDEKFDFPSGFYVVCGNPGSGKGFFALWLSRQFYQLHNKQSVYFSLEMAEELVRERLLQSWSDLTQQQYLDGVDTSQAKQLMRDSRLAIDKFYEDDTSFQIPDNFSDKVDEYYRQGYRIFHFDHLHELESSNTNDGSAYISDVWSKEFQKINKRYRDIWLFVFVQPNSEAAKKEFIKRVDVKGSKTITQRADFFISLNREAMHGKAQIDPVEVSREVIIYLDKSRTTSRAHFGSRLYFSLSGNYYESPEAAMMLRSIPPKVKSFSVEPTNIEEIKL